MRSPPPCPSQARAWLPASRTGGFAEEMWAPQARPLALTLAGIVSTAAFAAVMVLASHGRRQPGQRRHRIGCCRPCRQHAALCAGSVHLERATVLLLRLLHRIVCRPRADAGTVVRGAVKHGVHLGAAAGSRHPYRKGCRPRSAARSRDRVPARSLQRTGHALPDAQPLQRWRYLATSKAARISGPPGGIAEVVDPWLKAAGQPDGRAGFVAVRSCRVASSGRTTLSAAGFLPYLGPLPARTRWLGTRLSERSDRGGRHEGTEIPEFTRAGPGAGPRWRG